ncbi:MAG: alpha-glucosidase C-terminal domain-containing protein [Gloeobacteraceae cyanobacterium ES-bin-316]|nr:alpha-glucosidase C-terminal domain-containing protein [Ferruginibacter sp.]
MQILKFMPIPLLLLVCLVSCSDTKKETSGSSAAVGDTVVQSAASGAKWFANSNIYEVNLRQYSKEGTIKAFARSLPRLKDMGVEILWFMPVTPIGIEGRKQTTKDMGSYYAVRDYKAVNPDYGTMDDWKAFVNEAHSMGFKVITDWVANHSAPDNGWTKTHRQFYEKDSLGNLVSAFDWTDTRKLDYKNRELRDSMIAAMKFWLVETKLDGFRCDVAGEVPTDFWKECIDVLRGIKPDIFMLAEGEKPELHTAGFDASYAWGAMHAMKDLYTGAKTLTQFDSLLTANITSHPANAARMFFTTNHDENSWNGTEYEKYGVAYKTFAVFTQTMGQSIPLIYSGQELPNKRRLKFFVKDTIQWTGQYAMAPFYKTLLTLRKTNPAFASDASYRRLPSSNNDAVFAYVREKEGRKAVVVCNMSKTAQQFKVTDSVINGSPLNVFMGVEEKISDTHNFSIEPWGYIVYDYK